MFGGKCVTHGPATGAAIADLMRGRRGDVDLAPYDPARFARRIPARPERM